MDKYLLDANILIRAYRSVYPMDIMPSFWESLLAKAKDGTFALLDLIEDELLVKEDQLSEWLTRNRDDIEILYSFEPKVIDAYGEIINDVINDSQYNPSAKTAFADSVNSWLITYAYANGYTIVTEEKYNPQIKRKVQIPNVCKKFGVRCINTIEFLREVGIKI